MRMKFRPLVICMAILIAGSVTAVAQNLTAKQMNIYFGNPKSVITTNSQGTIKTEFDTFGRITKILQGNMHVVYDWNKDGSGVTLSMYQGANFMDSGTIEISVFNNMEYKYMVGGEVETTVIFKDNGAMDKTIMSNPQITGTMTFYYYSASDMFPYAIEQSMGVQSVVASVTINETDEKGNPTVYTQESMGNKDVTTQSIVYY